MDLFSSLPTDIQEYIHSLCRSTSLSAVHSELRAREPLCVLYTGKEALDLGRSHFSARDFEYFCGQWYRNAHDDLNDSDFLDDILCDEADWRTDYVVRNRNRHASLSDPSSLTLYDWIIYTGSILHDPLFAEVRF